MERSSILLDQALDLDDDDRTKLSSSMSGRVLLIQDCVETSGAFILHHLLKRSLSPNSSAVVIFVAFAQPFSHYDRVLRKMGCNLVVQRDSKRFLFIDMLKLDSPGYGKTKEAVLFELYGKIQKAAEVYASAEGKKKSITIMIDDISLMEVAAEGSSNYVLDFLHYCHTLTSHLGCSLVALNHEDIYATEGGSTFILQTDYLSDVVIKAEPLATGLAADVHGQLTVLNKEVWGSSTRKKVHNFHFKVKENGVEYFYPGSRS